MPVLRPSGTRTTTTKTGITYVQVTAEKVYDPIRKFNNDKRVTVGKMIDDKYMMPNDNFFTYFPDQITLIEAPDRSDVLKVGNHILFSSILKEMGIYDLMDEVYEDSSSLMKDVVSYMVVEETGVMQHFPDYGFDHPLFSEQIYSDSRISQMMRSLSISRHDLFLEKWNQMHNDVEDIYISYDSTNMNSAATGAQLLEFGHSKDEKSELPQINVSVGFDQTSLTPLFYELYPGSIIDNSQCEMMVDKVKRYGYKNIGFIIDRGYFSMDNINYFHDNDYDYIIMAKIDAKFVRKALQEAQYELRLGTRHYIESANLFGMTVKYPFNEKDIHDHYIHVYYDDIRGAYEREAMIKKFSAFDKNLDRLVDKKITRKVDVKKYEGYYILKFTDEYLQGYIRKEDKIREVIDKCGYFAIVTSKEMSAEEALNKYRHRDTSEKLFMVDKTFLESDTVRVYNDDSMESKQMLNFIGLILRNAIFKATKDLKEIDKKKYTVPSILREMEKIIITKDGKGKYSLRYALTKTQKAILSQFNITEKDFRNQAAEICKRYSD